MVPNLGIFISPRNFAIRQIRECWFQIWQYFFQIPELHIFGPKFRHFCFFAKFLQSGKFEGADFKYDNIVFKFHLKNTKIRHFWSKFWNFYFCTKRCSKTNSRTVIWIMTILFSNSCPKIRKLGIFGSKFKDFCFALYFAIRNIWRRWFQIWEWFFRIIAQKCPNKAFLCPKCIFLNFAWSFKYCKIWGYWLGKWQWFF